MALKLRPTGLGSGIDKNRPDYCTLSTAAGPVDVGDLPRAAVRWF